jgi:glycosyltransferase involved in cell wall biosynthesis
MIPAYNPKREYLEQTLRSVLAQDPGPGRMQIEVVDDCSPDVDVAAIVREIAGDRVSYTRNSTNTGLAGCWNACIQQSKGEWVHILHQDDWAMPGSYERFEKLFRAVEGLGAAFCRHVGIDSDGDWIGLGTLHQKTPGEMPDFADRVASAVPMECPSVVVKRSTYETLGGFREDLPYVLDWEMWARIAASKRWGYVPDLGAAYRYHDLSETARLKKAGKASRDLVRGGQIARANLPSIVQQRTMQAFRDWVMKLVMEDALKLYVYDQLSEARKLLSEFSAEARLSQWKWQWRWLRFRVLLKPARKLVAARERKATV